MSYVKITKGILASTVWLLSNETKLLWITLLVMADQHGEVEGSVPGLARIVGITVAEVAKGLEDLKAVDPYSRTKEHEGRRIKEVDGGWIILNYQKYREYLSTTDRKSKAAKRQAEYRMRQRNASQFADVTLDITARHMSQEVTQAEAEAEVDLNKKNTHSILTPEIQARDICEPKTHNPDISANAPIVFANAQDFFEQPFGDENTSKAPTAWEGGCCVSDSSEPEPDISADAPIVQARTLGFSFEQPINSHQKELEAPTALAEHTPSLSVRPDPETPPKVGGTPPLPKIEDIRARFRKGKANAPAISSPERVKAMLKTEAEKYRLAEEDPDENLPSVGKDDREGTLELFVVGLDTELDKGTLIELIGTVNEPMPGRAPQILVERLWESYRKLRPNNWQQPSELGKCRILKSSVDTLWKKLYDPAKTLNENCADIELTMRTALMFLHSRSWYSGSEFSNKNLNYLVRENIQGDAPMEIYSENWETLPAKEKKLAEQNLGKLLETREKLRGEN